jgi:hypothetical protein
VGLGQKGLGFSLCTGPSRLMVPRFWTGVEDEPGQGLEIGGQRSEVRNAVFPNKDLSHRARLCEEKHRVIY